MNENFLKFKKKRLLSAILKSVLLAVSAGLFCAGAALLVFKLLNAEIHVLWIVLIGILPALLVFAAAFFLLRPTDRKLAKSLDEQFALRERVQTSLAFAGQEGAILDLQREDTQQKLSMLPKQKPKVSQILRYAACLVVALALSVTSFVLPVKAEEPSPVPPREFTPSQYQISAVRELIKNVGEMDRLDQKQDLLEVLNSFLSDLENITTSAGMTVAVNATTKRVEDLLEEPITYLSVASALMEAGQPRLARAVVGGAEVYVPVTLLDANQFKTFETDLFSSAAIARTPIETETKIFLSSLEGAENPETALKQFSARTSEVMETFRKENPDVAEGNIFRSISSFLVKTGEMEEFISEDLENAVVALNNDLSKAASEESYALAAGSFVCNRIRTIFGFPIVSPKATDITGEGSGGSGSDDRQHGGGIGEGGLKAGSDDTVWDPDSGEYVKISDLLAKYTAILQELIRSGNLTEEQQELAEKYFQYLSNGIK